MAASDAFYTEIVAEVDAVLAELGTTYTVRAAGEYDPSTLEAGDGAGRTVVGLVATQQVINNMGVQSFAVSASAQNWKSAKTLILSASANPQQGEEVLVDGVWFPLNKVVEIKPADVTVVYLLDVAK